MEREQIIEVLREAQEIVEEAFGLSGDSMMKVGVMFWVVQELLPKAKVQLSPMNTMVARPLPPHKCPYLTEIKLTKSGWKAKCAVLQVKCLPQAGLGDYKECIHYKAEEAQRYMEAQQSERKGPTYFVQDPETGQFVEVSGSSTQQTKKVAQPPPVI